MVRYLERCKHDVVFIQELKADAHKCLEMQAKLRRKGWRFFFTPANETEKGAWSAGVGIAVKLHVDAWAAERPAVVLGRILKVYANLPTFGQVALYSVYLVAA